MLKLVVMKYDVKGEQKSVVDNIEHGITLAEMLFANENVKSVTVVDTTNGKAEFYMNKARPKEVWIVR